MWADTAAESDGSNASGNKRVNAVANKAPAAKLNKCCVNRDNKAYASKAASHTLPTPAMSVPNTMDIKVMAAS
jgi:hypothetical protein